MNLTDRGSTEVREALLLRCRICHQGPGQDCRDLFDYQPLQTKARGHIVHTERATQHLERRSK